MPIPVLHWLQKNATENIWFRQMKITWNQISKVRAELCGPEFDLLWAEGAANPKRQNLHGIGDAR